MASFDVEKAVKKLNEKLGNQTSGGQCAVTVRKAVAAGGVEVQPGIRYAKDYGPNFLKAGFKEVTIDKNTPYVPKKGDVVIIQSPSEKSPAGHMTMYNGSVWISDFEQRDMWSGPEYRSKAPAFAVYRYPFTGAGSRASHGASGSW